MRNVFFAVFAASGFSGLIYESIWTHYLKLFLGHAAYAQTLVLAIFMGGMAIGAGISSRYSARWNNLLRGYAVTEAIIGILALAFHPAFSGFVDIAYSDIIPRLGSAATATAFRWGAAALLILPQSVLLGMTFPLMSAGVIRRYPEHPGHTIAMLYFTNSLGGAVGVLASGFWLIALVGLPGTIVLAGLINLALAVLVWRLAPATALRESAHRTAPAAHTAASNAVTRLLLAAAFLTGLASLIYEIGWIRMLSLVLGSSTHAFELMLSAFIFGLAFGGLWIRRRIDGIGDPMRYLGGLQIAMGALALATLPLYNWTFEAMKWMLGALPVTAAGYSWFNVGSHGIALAVMLPATFCAGTTLPLLTYALLRAGRGEESIGAVYAANTVGAIAGVFVAVHLGMPLLGLKGLIAFGAALDMGLGVVLLSWGWKRGGWRVPALGMALGAGAVAAVLLWVQLDPYKMASGVFRNGRLLSATNAEVLAQQDGKTATVHLTQEGHTLSIRTNGKVDAGVNMTATEIDETLIDESTMVLAGGLALCLHPQAKAVANIGFGSGLSTHTLLTVPSVATVDTVEIEPAMVAIARAFRPRNELAYTDPRSRILFEDAKAFFATHGGKYDLIVSEPPNPWVSGVAGLFSAEFYRLARRYLNDRGLLVQWLQLYEIDFDLVASVLKALGSTFDDYVIFAANDMDVLIVARNGGPVPPLDGSPLGVPRLSAELARIGIKSVADLEVRRIASKRLLAPLLARTPVAANSDYYPLLDQRAARARFLRTDARELVELGAAPLPGLELLGMPPRLGESTAITPSDHYLASQLYHAATVLRDAAAGGGARVRWPPPNSKAAQALRRVIADCAEPAVGGEKIDALLNVGMDVVPFLRPAELAAVWRWVETQPCGTALNPHESDWLVLFKAVGERNPEEMARRADLLLERDDGREPRRTRYLMMTAMLGHIARGERAAARKIWSRYGGKVAPDERSRMLIKLLAAHGAVP